MLTKARLGHEADGEGNHDGVWVLELDLLHGQELAGSFGGDSDGGAGRRRPVQVQHHPGLPFRHLQFT